MAFPTRLHTLLVWLPAERTKVVIMDAPLNKYGFEMSFWLILLRLSCGLSALRSWKSTKSSSTFAEHKVTPKKFLTVFFRRRRPSSWSGFGGLGIWVFLLWVVVWESIKGSGSGEQPGRWERGESWGFNAEGTVGGFEEEFVGLFWRNFSNGGDDRGAGLGYCVGSFCCVTSGDDLWFYGNVGFCLVSSLSLRLFRSVEVSISSGCSPSLFFFFVFLPGSFCGDKDCDGGWVDDSVSVVTVAFLVAVAFVVGVFAAFLLLLFLLM